MTVLLQEAFEKVSRLPETLQDEIARELLADVETEAYGERIELHIKQLVENGHIEEARHLVSTLQPGASIVIDNWRKALSMPIAKLDKPAAGENIKEDALWLQDNTEKYKGKWIALKCGTLLGSHESRSELRHSLRKKDKLSGALFFKIDK